MDNNISDEVLRAQYREEMLTKKESAAQDASLDMSYAGWSIDVPDIQALPNDEYALHRKKGLGGSDSSVVLNVNPYKTVQELIKEKARDHLTDEEKAVGEKVPVRKGRDLEPLIIDKFEKAFNSKTYKPIDMYVCDAHPYLKMNFDGVTGDPGNYIPVEIKVVTAPGERHYNPTKAIYCDRTGERNQIPIDVSTANMSLHNKAAHYGIPVYYYTQLQQEITACGARYGYLNVLYDRTWTMYTFFVWRDAVVHRDLIVTGYKVWQKVVELNPERAVSNGI